MIIITGAAGFIGSCLVRRLNDLGRQDLLLVDHLNHDQKEANLADKKYHTYYDRDDFIQRIHDDQVPHTIEAVLHMGACSSTTLQDAEYYRVNNLEYSKTLARWCVEHKVHYIYASSAATYGDGEAGYKDDLKTIQRCRPLNLYGQSKQDFDLWVIEQGLVDRFVGLKFFNVFGPNEYHKGDMRSVVAKAYPVVRDEGVMKLFRSYRPDFADGEQKRDFIYVQDVVNVILFFFQHPEIGGIFNVGTGKARSWNDVANALFRALKKEPRIDYVDMPDILKDKYQYFTEADMARLRAVGYLQPFTELEAAIEDYVSYLGEEKHL